MHYLVAVPLGLALAACSTSMSVPSGEVAAQVSEQITTSNSLATPVSVSCNGDLAASIGATQTCTVADPISGTDRSVTVTVTSVQGTDVSFDISETPSPSASPAAS